MATTPANPNPARSIPLYTRTILFLRIWSFKVLVKLFSRFQSRFRPRPLAQQPTFLKVYPIRKYLENRVFIPHSYKAGEILPLYLNIHGGGFALCDPSFDDEWCAHMCHTYKILIVSLDYSKSPRARFPVPTQDIEVLIDAVLSDDLLPIDKTRVAIGGFSAGGNLALSAVQAPRLRGKIHAVVPIYPVLDFVAPAEEKAKSRPYHNEKDVDGLMKLSEMFNWGYIKPDENRADPRLSVCYARKEDLPKWVFMLAAEYDMLSGEAREMIWKLAAVKDLNPEERKFGFEIESYRWKLIRGVEHGYTQSFGPATEGDLARQGREETYKEVGKWLFKGPFATTKIL